MRWTALAAFASLTALAVGCGGEDADSSQDAAPPAAAVEIEARDASSAVAGRVTNDGATRSRAGQGKLIEVVRSEYGHVVADARGEAFYLFDKEDTSKSKCYGTCARVWPPVLTSGRPRAGNGAKERLLGTTRRANGKLQVTYAGHPLYYYVDDSPGTILCQNVAEFGGLWLVVKPSGGPVT